MRSTSKKVYAMLEGKFSCHPAKNIWIKHYVMLIQLRQAQQRGLRITVMACYAVPFVRLLIRSPKVTQNEWIPNGPLYLRAVGRTGRYVGLGRSAAAWPSRCRGWGGDNTGVGSRGQEERKSGTKNDGTHRG